MTMITINPNDAHDHVDLLRAFALTLEHPDFPDSIALALADTLGDLGGARYGVMPNGHQQGADFVAQKCSELASRMESSIETATR